MFSQQKRVLKLYRLSEHQSILVSHHLNIKHDIINIGTSLTLVFLFCDTLFQKMAGLSLICLFVTILDIWVLSSRKPFVLVLSELG